MTPHTARYTTGSAALARSVRDNYAVEIPVLVRRRDGQCERATLAVRGINGRLYRAAADELRQELEPTERTTVRGWGRHHDGPAVVYDGRWIVSERLLNGLGVDAPSWV